LCLKIRTTWYDAILSSLFLSFSLRFIDLFFMQIVIIKSRERISRMKRNNRNYYKSIGEKIDIKSTERSFTILFPRHYISFLQTLLFQNRCLNLTFAIPLNDLYRVCRNFAEMKGCTEERARGQARRIVIFRFPSVLFPFLSSYILEIHLLILFFQNWRIKIFFFCSLIKKVTSIYNIAFVSFAWSDLYSNVKIPFILCHVTYTFDRWKKYQLWYFIRFLN